MILARLARLVVQSIQRNRRDFIFSSVGIVVGIATLLFFTSLGNGIKRVVLEQVFVVRQLEVEKKTYDIGGLRTGGLFGGGQKLDDATVERLRAIPGVSGVYPKMKLTFPARAHGGGRLLGQDMGTELVADGIPTELVGPDDVRGDLAFIDWGGDVACGEAGGAGVGGDGAGGVQACPAGFACEAGRCEPQRCDPAEPVSSVCGAPAYCDAAEGVCAMPIPVIVNPMLLEIYNGSMHTALGGSRGPGSKLPRLSQDMLIGFEFDAVFGESFLGRAAQGRALRQRMRLVGFSDKAINLGATIPIGYVKRLNGRFSGEEAAAEYHSIVVETESNDAIARVAHTITEEMGLSLTERYANAQRAGLLIMLITLVFNLIALIILAISAINIMHTFLMLIIERRRELGLMRALGATRRHIRLLVLGEATVLGLLGGTGGALIGWAATRGVDAAFHRYVGDFPFKPDSLFLFEPWMFAAALGVALVFCWLGALLPAFRASRTEPAAAISGP